MAARFRLGSSLVAALLSAVLVLLGGPGAQAAGACGSTALAHRGAWSSKVDENTIESIERAHQLGAFTENDVFLSSDGGFVIIHNQSLRHTTNCTGDVKNTPLAVIKQCRTTPNGLRIPTAVEVFNTLAGNPGQLIDLEVKGPGWFQHGNAKLVELRNAAVAAGVLNRVFFSNDTTYQTLTALRDSAPNAQTAWKPDSDEPDFTPAHASALSTDAVMAWGTQWSTKEKVAGFQQAGFQVWAKRSDNQQVWTRNWRLGLKAQLTNLPGTYKTWCNSVV
ncbi:MAG TPA: glycerophosphodiester phosphodiesterase family protein [Nocardioidaceae bacterium]|nr:glycerophosphodiester phosphodiesterase family protein [Nocardioidaceae bacterium]